MDDIRTIKPSDSPALQVSEVMRVRDFLHRVTGLIQKETQADNFSTAAGNWTKDRSSDFYKICDRLFRGHADDLKFFRFFCKCFSGYSLFDRKLTEGTAFPYDLPFTDRTADQNWTTNALTDPTDIFRSHDFLGAHRRRTYDLPPGLIFQPPLRLGEAGWIRNGRFISVDQVYYQERLSLLYFGGLINYLENKIAQNGEARILEIGGGYGALAFALKSYLPQASYTIVDLPQSLAFSGTYLTLLRPDLPHSLGLDPTTFGFRFVPAAQAQDLQEPFDLVINTLSMSEMTESQVAEYCRLMSKIWLKDEGFFFEQNTDNSAAGLINAEDIIGRHLERKMKFVPHNFGFRRGNPSIWQTAGANTGIVLQSLYPTYPKTKILEASGHSIIRDGADYLIMIREQIVAREASLEDALSRVTLQK